MVSDCILDGEEALRTILLADHPILSLPCWRTADWERIEAVIPRAEEKRFLPFARQLLAGRAAKKFLGKTEGHGR